MARRQCVRLLRSPPSYPSVENTNYRQWLHTLATDHSDRRPSHANNHGPNRESVFLSTSRLISNVKPLYSHPALRSALDHRCSGISERTLHNFTHRALLHSLAKAPHISRDRSNTSLGVTETIISNRRQFSTKQNSSKHDSVASTTNITYRDALKSPRNAIAYVGYLCRELVAWAQHMWAGVKLLAADVSVSSRILRRVALGKQLSRRERNFIVQTGVDLARLVPFSLFLIIPLAEFALPFALRLFPNMLPSQFQDQMKSEENLKRRLKARLELAKYLREVVEERAKLVKRSDTNSELKQTAEDLTEFLDAVRNGKDVSSSDVSRFARFFNDELTIDGAVRPQLVAMCKYMGISHYGHESFLRFKLRSRLNAIKKDDMEIMWEGGVDSLTDAEVAKACRDRGMREEMSNKAMREQLGDWLDLSQRKEIPSSLLILSRAFLYVNPENGSEGSEEGLAEALGSMPEDVIMDVRQAADIGEETTESRLQETLRQAKLIELESEREARKEKEDEEKKKRREAEEEEEAQLNEIESEKAMSSPTDSISDAEAQRATDAHESELAQSVLGRPVGVDSGAEVDSERQSPVEASSKDEEQLEEEREQVKGMLESLGQLSSDSAVEKEREELRNLKVQLVEAEDQLKGTEEEGASDIRRFKAIVSKLEREIERVDTKVGLKMKLLDQDNDGLMSLDECKDAMKVIAGVTEEEVVTTTLERLDADADGNISKADLARLLQELQNEHGLKEGFSREDQASTPKSGS